MSTSAEQSLSNDSIECIDTSTARARLRGAICNALSDKRNVVIRAPTSLGKSYTIATTSWRERTEITGNQPLVHLSPTTAARDSAVEKNSESEAESEQLLGREDACDMAAGKYDSELRAPDGSDPSAWFDEMCDDRGLPFSVAHRLFGQNHDGSLPCRPCAGPQQWKDVPRHENDDPSCDVVFATHNFAHAPALTEDCNVLIDELADFSQNLDVGDIRKPVRSYLEQVDAPVTTWEDLMASHAGHTDEPLAPDELDEPDQEWILHDKESHVLAPGVVRALLTAEEQCHDRWKGEVQYTYPDLLPGTDTVDHRVRIRVVFDENNDLKLLQALPDLTEARCVIGLDAFPTEPKWRMNTLPEIEFNRILTDQERQSWRHNERNLEIVQVGENKNSWTRSGFNSEKVTTLAEELRDEYGEAFATGATSKRFESELRECLESAGIDNPETIHYGEEKSVEQFANERVGLIAGCISPSSESIKDWLALLEKQATPKREVDDDYEGQAWVGPDAETARELLADVREKHVLQTVGRYARSPDDPDDGAEVYVLTNVLPDKFVDRHVDGVEVLGEKTQEILATVADASDGLTTRQISGRVDASRKHVHDIVNKYLDTDWLHVAENAGDYNADKYYADRSPEYFAEI